MAQTKILIPQIVKFYFQSENLIQFIARGVISSNNSWQSEKINIFEPIKVKDNFLPKKNFAFCLQLQQWIKKWLEKLHPKMNFTWGNCPISKSVLVKNQQNFFKPIDMEGKFEQFIYILIGYKSE